VTERIPTIALEPPGASYGEHRKSSASQLEIPEVLANEGKVRKIVVRARLIDDTSPDLEA
jgi:hypothetical protein